jgi:putative lipoic acid-binding regulatory protein
VIHKLTGNQIVTGDPCLSTDPYLFQKADDLVDDQERQQVEYSLALLEETHDFPCGFMLKVIGRAEEAFVERVVAAIRQCQQAEVDPPFRVRQTPNGRHVAVTLEPHVQSAEEVLALYQRIRTIRGVVMVM